jgi:hypothetical protein
METALLNDSFTSELLTYSLERLNHEPELNRTEGDRVKRQQQELAVSSYSTFLQAAECTSSVRNEVAGIREHLDLFLQAREAPSRHARGAGRGARVFPAPVAERSAASLAAVEADVA